MASTRIAGPGSAVTLEHLESSGHVRHVEKRSAGVEDGRVVRRELKRCAGLQTGSQHVVDRNAGGWRVTAVATFGDSVFLLESSDVSNAGQRVRVLRGSGSVELLGQVEP